MKSEFSQTPETGRRRHEKKMNIREKKINKSLWNGHESIRKN